MNTETRGAILFGAYALTLTLAMAAAAGGAGHTVVIALAGLGVVGITVAGIAPWNWFRDRRH